MEKGSDRLYKVSIQDKFVSIFTYTHYVLVVGHTMAFCYQKRQPGIHPPDAQAECSLGLVRPTNDLSAVCVDGGMYLGARAYLEIGLDGHMRAYERRGEEHKVAWKVKDLTEETCGKYLQKDQKHHC